MENTGGIGTAIAAEGFFQKKKKNHSEENYYNMAIVICENIINALIIY